MDFIYSRRLTGRLAEIRRLILRQNDPFLCNQVIVSISSENKNKKKNKHLYQQKQKRILFGLDGTDIGITKCFALFFYVLRSVQRKL